MNKKPLKCKYGLTIKCTHWDNPAMDRLFTTYNYASPSLVDITTAGSICRRCKSFEPLPKATVVSAMLDLMIQPDSTAPSVPPAELVPIDIPWPLANDVQV
jgi:hypothetical protein